jgi:hypothetical protein
MPLTRPLTCEEDVTMSLSTVITGLVTKYNTNGRIGAPELLTSIFANTALGINELIEGSNLTLAEKAQLRGDMKVICDRAMRASINLVTPDGMKVKMPGNVANETTAPAAAQGDEHPDYDDDGNLKPGDKH